MSTPPAPDPSVVSPAATPLGQDLALLAGGAGARVSPELLAAYARAASPNSLRAFRGDVMAFDSWCRVRGLVTIPARPQTVADFLAVRAAAGAAPASLVRYRASLAKLHRLCGLADPTRDELVRLTLAAHRREVGVAQRQARPLRFRGAVADPARDAPRGINVRAALESCADTLPGRRDRALLSLAYDTGLRASELVAVQREHLVPATDPAARLLLIPRSKGDRAGEGATAYVSPRSVAALEAWCRAAEITAGPVFRRVIVRRYRAVPARPRIDPASVAWHARRDRTWFAGQAARPAREDYHVGTEPLHPGSITPIFRRILRRAFAAGAFGDLDPATFADELRQISAHSTRVGVNQDYFASGEDLAGIMDALRWKSPRMPLLYNRNLAAEHGAAGRMLGRLR